MNAMKNGIWTKQVGLVARLCLLLLGFLFVQTVYAGEGQLPRVYNATFYGLQQIDVSPLGNRKPLLLIHGISPESGEYDGWGNFIQFTRLNNDKANRLNEHFKVFIFRYPPDQPLQKNAKFLARELTTFKQLKSNQLLTVVAHSLGGLIIKEVMLNDEGINQEIDRVVTIGTPFHGTPLADPAWVKARFQDDSFTALKKIPTKVAYNVTENKFPYFRSDFCWDNFNLALPQNLLTEDRAYCPNRSAGGQVNLLNAKRLLSVSEKFITYGSFFGKQDDIPVQLVQQVFKPEQQHMFKFPETLESGKFSKHAMMEKARRYMAEVPLSEPYQENSVLKSLFELNDGVSPVMSHLWLGRFMAQVQEEAPVTPSQNIDKTILAFQSLPENAKVRLFQNLDHRDWMEGSSRLYPKGGQNGSPAVSLADIFHPNLGKRTVFEWLLVDILAPSVEDEQNLSLTVP